MSQAHEWRLIFACPLCGKSSCVTGTAMGSVLRCPHCRKRVIISRDGIKQAPLASGWRPPQIEKAVEAAPKECRRSVLYRVCAFLVLGLVTVCALAAVQRGGTGPNSSARDRDALVAAAQEFQHAWLADDLKSAQAFVLGQDAALLSSWSLPRRAALVASFGAQFESKVTAVDVVETRATQSTVRTRFVIRGREQQSFQTWKRTAEGWKLLLTMPDVH